MLERRLAVATIVAASVLVLQGVLHAAYSTAARAQDQGIGATQSAPQPDVVIRISPSSRPSPGSGQVHGTKTGQTIHVGLRSLAAALDRVGELRRQSSRDLAIVVELGRGIHRLERPVIIGAGQSGSVSRPLVIRGQRDGSTIIRGSVELIRLPALPAAVQRRLPATARDHVLAYRLPPGLPPNAAIDRERFHPELAAPLAFEVFDEAGALWPARWPNEGWARVTAVLDDRRFTLKAPRLAAWRGEPELWAAGTWAWEWSYESQRVGRVDATAGTLALATAPHYALKPNARFFVYHALAELDAPGEWYREATNNTLLLWPRANERRAAATEVSVCDSAFVLSGASHVRIEHLTIERFRGDAVRVEGGRNVVITQSAIRWAAGRGAAFIRASSSGVQHSSIADTGEGGVLLDGGDRASLAPGRLFVSDSRIERFSRLGRTSKPAIRIDGVGNTASGNLIRGSPHIAIMFQGNDHVIERNEITDVATDSSDASAIYTGRDWTARGTVIRGNFLHDLRPGAGFETKGIYLDDMASGIKVLENLFVRVDQPVFIGGGRDNVVEANVFIASPPAIHIDSRGLNWAKDAILDPRSDLRRHLEAMPYLSAVWRVRYPMLPGVLLDEPGMAKRNVARRNLIIGSEPYRLVEGADRAAQSIGQDHVIDPAPASVLTAVTARSVADSLRSELQLYGLTALALETMDRSSLLPPLRLNGAGKF